MNSLNLENASLLEEMYEKYQNGETQVDPSWEQLFNQLTVSPRKSSQTPSTCDEERIQILINAYRQYGHLMAKVNPIALAPPETPTQLKLENLGFTADDLQREFPTNTLLPQGKAPLNEIVQTLQGIYCQSIGYECTSLDNPELESWIQQKIESSNVRTTLSIAQKQMILQELNKSELLETFLHTKFPAQKRFSIEGGETLIPMLKSTIEMGSKSGVDSVFIGMAHRGRLNVLSNILNKSYSDIFSEFNEEYIPSAAEGTSDVKYHKGFCSEMQTADGKKVQITLAPNPSHLEAVDPVVEGMTLAKQIKINDTNKEKVLPILIHGDAAVSGQGIIYETLQLYRLAGYTTGGTIHFVINNQVGFTATPEEMRSTRHCTDIAHAFSAPIFHVNAEDPEACIFVTNLALEIRQKFHCETFIDLNCYRKYGHNEGDEPAFTQPLEYQIIRKKRPIREIYHDQLIKEGVTEKHIVEQLEKEFTQSLQQALSSGKSTDKNHTQVTSLAKGETETSQPIETKISQEKLKQISALSTKIPDGFTIHPKLQNLIKERSAMVNEKKSIDWGMAEHLAFASILLDGFSIRLSGQDSERGTFSHRHAVWIDQKNEKTYIPLAHLTPNQGRFDVLNSALSEYGVVGFEYGYSVESPKTLVLWEAQFGDFCNAAQITIDQFISTGEQKWGQKSGLTFLLPHGYEGQGPEHSSARMERFLTLAGCNNLRIANPTTPAQFFHLLRKQILDTTRKPLIVFTPKGLLRHPACKSSVEELTSGKFEELIDDSVKKEQIKELLFCSGRIYYDLIEERKKRGVTDIAFLRIEQLYPLNLKKIKEMINTYTNVKEYIWAQEEPQNMGAWSYMYDILKPLLPNNQELQYRGRLRSASPAVGSHFVHHQQLTELMNSIFSNNSKSKR